MATIHVLDKDTINQIAAGEVVERPASIVKELVENAVDARSTAVTIEIKGGGIDFIRITDNGSGIDKDQVPTAFLRHATSKIQDASDLETVSSLGFRGEALSSIAAVAKVELVTKTDVGISGVRYVIEGGEEITNEEIGCPEGTTFLVRDLFYNTPARRKFLKSKMTEAGYVEAFVQRLALSHPEVSFRFICDNKNKISTSGNGNLKDVIYHIFGREFASNLLEVQSDSGRIKIRGYIGKPSISRGNRNYENYFVNGRYLRSNIISRAIEDGYKGHAMVHKFPFTVLMIEMDAHYFDVNVHPAKLEMRFENGDELYSSVMTAVKQSFVQKELIPSVGIGREKREKRENLKQTPEPFEQRRRNIEERFKNLSRDKIEQIQKNKQIEDPADDKEAEYTPKHTGESLMDKVARLRLNNLDSVKADIDKAFEVSDSSKYGTKTSNPVGDSSAIQASAQNATLEASPAGSSTQEALSVSASVQNATLEASPAGTSAQNATLEASPAGTSAQDAFSVSASAQNATLEASPAGTSAQEASPVSASAQNAPGAGLTGTNSEITGTQITFADTPLLSEEARPRHRIIGQVFRTYWLVEYEDNLFFVDQHAAHEKVMYEKMKKNLAEKVIDQQMVAPPIVLNLSMKEKEMLEQCRASFEELGYQVEEFGSDAYAIRAVPANLYGLNQQDLFIDILDQMDDNLSKMDITMITDKLASMSCKAAVKGNQRISYQEMDALMDQLLTLEDPYQCPHGRPTIISMSRYEIEKKFHR